MKGIVCACSRRSQILGPFDCSATSTVEEGWRCAEFGAGGGSMAEWIADQVGESGLVVAVDRDVTLIKHLADRPMSNLSRSQWRI